MANSRSYHLSKNMFVAVVVCGRRGLWPSWFVAVIVEPLLLLLVVYRISAPANPESSHFSKYGQV